MLLKTQLRWAGHISRMEDHCLPKIVFYGELATGCHKRSASKRRYKDSLKQYLSLGHIDYHQWSTLASNWEIWRHIIHNAAVSFENTCRISLEKKRQCRKSCALPIPPKETFCYAFAIGLVYPALVFLAISMLAVSVGKALLESSFMKPSHDIA
ncbi:hypothetical protein AAES_142204 [Amazona aestiva]|uniref:Uncharacterized protein n=1 Tax=Amazona aestiva TaxID=12930 RepID=A0A0Q3UQL6_AMAAE|nr:hypothetical protein AAES_145344 [Amazona aestiva]KQK75720.1 hypothetical protein AAES_142204 [Amazona aestiva]